MERRIVLNGIEAVVAMEKRDDGYMIRVGDREYAVTGVSIAEGVLNFFVGTKTCRAIVSQNALGTQITLSGRDYVLAGEEEEAGGGAHHHGDGSVESPMPGNIVAVHVKPGDRVEGGASLVVLESMKMQNEITAPLAGEVTAVHCATGDQVGFGAVLVEITPG